MRGLTGVSLGDVADAVGLSKSGLFKHFVSKDEMQMAVVETVMDKFTRLVWTPVEPLAPGRARLEGVFERWLRWGETEWPDSGCPIVALSVELDDQPGPLRDLLQKRLQQWRRTLLREFRALRDPPLSDAEAEGAYFQMKSFVLGGADARRMMGDADGHRSAQAAFHALLDRASA